MPGWRRRDCHCSTQAHQAADLLQADRQGTPEIIWARGKTPAQIALAMRQAAAANVGTLAVRIEPDVAAAVMRELPEATFNQAAGCLRWAVTMRMPMSSTLDNSPVWSNW